MGTAPAPVDYAPMPIIVGAPRSGTTLLRLMLDAHSDLAIPPETGFLASDMARLRNLSRSEFAQSIEQFPPDAPGWTDFGIATAAWRRSLEALDPFDIRSAFRTFYGLYAARFAKSRWGEKTPGYVLCMDQIEILLPESHFIHLIRDGRDVALSWRQTWFSPGHDMKTLAQHWKHWVLTGLEHGKARKHYLELRYEELLENTAASLQRICEHIDLDFQPAMLHYYQNSPARLQEHGERRRLNGQLLVSRSERLQQQVLTTQPPRADRVQAWRATLTRPERDAFASVAGDLLEQLGYQV